MIPLLQRGMARYNVSQTSDFPFHITGRCPNRESFRIPINDVWAIMEDYLYLAHIKYNFRIHSFVLMPNHFHLIASSTDTKIGKPLGEFLCNSSKEFNYITNRINQNWGGRHYKCELSNFHYFMNTYKYVYQNPVRAKLVSKVEEWRYSTLNRICGFAPLTIPLEPDSLLFNPGFDESCLSWLNTPITDENYAAIKLALTKVKFKLPLKNEKPNLLEHQKI